MPHAGCVPLPAPPNGLPSSVGAGAPASKAFAALAAAGVGGAAAGDKVPTAGAELCSLCELAFGALSEGCRGAGADCAAAAYPRTRPRAAAAPDAYRMPIAVRVPHYRCRAAIKRRNVAMP